MTAIKKRTPKAPLRITPLKLKGPKRQLSRRDLTENGEDIVLYEGERNSRNEVFRVTASKFRGRDYVRMGEWYWSVTDRDGNQHPGRFKPSKSGVSLPIDGPAGELAIIAMRAVIAFVER